MKIVKAEELEEAFFEYKEGEEISHVKEIINEVRERGDEALRHYTRVFDGIELKRISVEPSKIREACEKLDKNTLSCLKKASINLKKFSGNQRRQFRDFELAVTSGVFCSQRVIPIERIGIYVPAGRFPLVSSLLMCGIPARTAGVKEIAVCSPPCQNGSVHSSILAACDILGIDEVYAIGGAQAIAAMAYGTKTIRRVDKIVGPGNKYVSQAKREVFGRVGIDFIAGPTEIMIIADEFANPQIVASDLIAQAEHDSDAIPILVTDSFLFASRVRSSLETALTISAGKTAQEALERNGVIILVENLEEAFSIANMRAPEHLSLQIRNLEKHKGRFKNYGSLFFGENAAEALGDYSCGLNHTLPTNTCARYTGGLGVKDFLKLQTTLRVTKKGLRKIGPIASGMARIEGLEGHARSIDERMNTLYEGEGGLC